MSAWARYPPDVPLGYDELVVVARSFLPQQPFFLLAESFSGPIALAIAATRPPGLLGVILCCSFARNPLPLLSPFRAFPGAFPVAALPLAWLDFFVLGRFSSSELRAALAKALALVTPAVLCARARAALSVDCSSLLSRLAVPVLYLRASEDRIVSRSSLTLIRSLAPHVETIDFIAPHFLLQVLPESAAAATEQFMTTHRMMAL